ncbi:MAG: nucleoid-associated protein [Alphaproteobacteria bacterium]|nr:nucleoid-associated protein [Alphaproteobacteria bacterium]
MIIKLNKAILHICNVCSGSLINSDDELDVTQGAISDYIMSHIERVFANPAITKGKFTTDSELKSNIQNYVNQNSTFVNISQYISDRMYSEYMLCKKPTDFDVIVADFVADSKHYIGILKLKGKNGYVHQIMNSNGMVFNDLLGHNSVLPFLNQNIDESAFISIPDLTIRYISKEHIIDGERYNILQEVILECRCDAKSSKDIVDDLKCQLRKTKTPIENALKVNDYISNQATSNDSDKMFSYKEIADIMFNEESEKNAFIDQALKGRSISDAEERFEIDDYIISKTNEKIKIETDNGCEIKFPAHLFNDATAGIVIKKASDRVTITISGISEYKLK